MRRPRNALIELTCPECEGDLTVEVSPQYPMVVYRGGGADPPEPAEIVEVHGHLQSCPLVDDDEDDRFYQRVIQAIEEQEQAAYDREMDSRLERERDRE